MRRYDVPAERVELELGKRPPDDRGRRLGAAATRELPLRRERDPRDARSAPPSRLPNKEEARAAVVVEIPAEPLPAQIRSLAVAVEVERRSDACGGKAMHELLDVHSVTMLTRVRGCVAATAAFCLLAWAAAAVAAPPPQGYQSDAAFARSYFAQHVAGVVATTQRVSCYAPEVPLLRGLGPSEGFPDGGGTICPGATSGENVGPYPSQDMRSQAILVKDHSESDIDVDPTDSRHVVGVSKWFVNAEGYNHLAGFFESFDGGATWPQQGHIPGYEGWTDNSDPVGAFDPWGNFYLVVLPYMFDYLPSGRHDFAAARVNPSLPRTVLGVAVRPHGATTADAWLTSHRGRLDLVASAPFARMSGFDKQWIAIDTSRGSPHFGRVYVVWAIGASDDSLRIYESHADAHPDGSHGDWSTPRPVLKQARGYGDNGAFPRVAPDGTVWLTTASFHDERPTFTTSLTSSRDGGTTWDPRRVVVRGHLVRGYQNTTFRAAFGETFAAGSRLVGHQYPLYLAYEGAGSGLTNLFLTASFDGGRRWSRPIRVNDNRAPAEALQPNLAVAANGTVSVAFYDRRLACPARSTAAAARAGLSFDPRAPYGRRNYCINTAVQFYRPRLRPIGHNVRVSADTWDPQLSAARFVCACSTQSFIGDYFGVDSGGGWTYTASVTTADADGTNPLFHQQQLVSKLQTP